MPRITMLGDGKAMLALSVLLMILVSKPKKISGILMLAGLAISSIVVYVLKHIVTRPRPFVVSHNVHLLVKELDKNHSFPSGHATLAFMAAVILAAYFRRGYVFFLIAAVICFSRVYIGVHYVSDVVAGAILGSVIGYALVYAAKRLRRE